MMRKVRQEFAQRQTEEIRVAVQLAHNLVSELEAAAEHLGRVERRELPPDMASPETIERITHAWAAWRLNALKKPNSETKRQGGGLKAERGEFLRALKSAISMVKKSEIPPRRAARWMLGFVTFSYRFDRLSTADRKRATALCGWALRGLRRKRRHKKGASPWSLVADVVFLLWRERHTGESLRVEAAA
jgi:hypothetical protein